jgi:vacuolar-type H+-ATPase subunit D/Vma8
MSANDALQMLQSFHDLLHRRHALICESVEAVNEANSLASRHLDILRRLHPEISRAASAQAHRCQLASIEIRSNKFYGENR